MLCGQYVSGRTDRNAIYLFHKERYQPRFSELNVNALPYQVGEDVLCVLYGNRYLLFDPDDLPNLPHAGREWKFSLPRSEKLERAERVFPLWMDNNAIVETRNGIFLVKDGEIKSIASGRVEEFVPIGNGFAFVVVGGRIRDEKKLLYIGENNKGAKIRSEYRVVSRGIVGEAFPFGTVVFVGNDGTLQIANVGITNRQSLVQSDTEDIVMADYYNGLWAFLVSRRVTSGAGVIFSVITYDEGNKKIGVFPVVQGQSVTDLYITDSKKVAVVFTLGVRTIDPESGAQEVIAWKCGSRTDKEIWIRCVEKIDMELLLPAEDYEVNVSSLAIQHLPS